MSALSDAGNLSAQVDNDATTVTYKSNLSRGLNAIDVFGLPALEDTDVLLADFDPENFDALPEEGYDTGTPPDTLELVDFDNTTNGSACSLRQETESQVQPSPGGELVRSHLNGPLSPDTSLSLSSLQTTMVQDLNLLKESVLQTARETVADTQQKTTAQLNLLQGLGAGVNQKYTDLANAVTEEKEKFDDLQQELSALTDIISKIQESTPVKRRASRKRTRTSAVETGAQMGDCTKAVDGFRTRLAAVATTVATLEQICNLQEAQQKQFATAKEAFGASIQANFTSTLERVNKMVERRFKQALRKIEEHFSCILKDRIRGLQTEISTQKAKIKSLKKMIQRQKDCNITLEKNGEELQRRALQQIQREAVLQGTIQQLQEATKMRSRICHNKGGGRVRRRSASVVTRENKTEAGTSNEAVNGFLQAYLNRNTQFYSVQREQFGNVCVTAKYYCSMKAQHDQTPENAALSVQLERAKENLNFLCGILHLNWTTLTRPAQVSLVQSLYGFYSKQRPDVTRSNYIIDTLNKYVCNFPTMVIEDTRKKMEDTKYHPIAIWGIGSAPDSTLGNSYRWWNKKSKRGRPPEEVVQNIFRALVHPLSTTCHSMNGADVERALTIDQAQ